jgi:hypothetical protein
MQTFRASYSTLAAWARGDYDLALGMYFKTTDFDTEAMALGRALHEEWEREIKASNNMPAVFGGKPIPGEYKAEVFARKQLAPWLELRGMLDLMVPEWAAGFDWKSGTTPSSAWANSMQHKVYQVLYPQLKRFEYHAFNPYAKASEAVTVSIVHLDEQTKEDGVEWVVTYASEMKNYIEQNNLEAQFAALPKVRRA